MLAILTTHPIQYQIPIWQALAQEGKIPFEVWYLSKHGVKPSHDTEFKKSFSWDLNLLSGYPHRFLETAGNNGRVDYFFSQRLNGTFMQELKAKSVRALWIQGWQVLAYWQAAWQASQMKVPVWLRGESNDLAPATFWKKAVKRTLLGNFFKKIDQFLFIGKANRRLYESFGVPSGRLHPALYAVDNERFAQQAEKFLPERTNIRRTWNIPDDAFCILFAGKFIPKKRPFDLVHACLSAFSHFPTSIKYRYPIGWRTQKLLWRLRKKVVSNLDSIAS